MPLSTLLRPFKCGKTLARAILVVGIPNNDLMLLQQPIPNEHAILLEKCCESSGFKPDWLYITNSLKCTCKTTKQSYYTACRENLEVEIEEIQPPIIVVAGDDASKILRDYTKIPVISIPSLHNLFSNREGIHRVESLLTILKDTYFV